MLTRCREMFRRDKTVEDSAKEHEKYSLRVLEECKRTITTYVEIAKNDRLEIRKHIRNNSQPVLDLFRKHRSNSSIDSIKLRPQRTAGGTQEVHRQVQTHPPKPADRVVQEFDLELAQDDECWHQDSR